MTSIKIKNQLLEIANRIKPSITIEEVYEQIALFSDIGKSEEQEKQGKVFTHTELTKNAEKLQK